MYSSRATYVDLTPSYLNSPGTRSNSKARCCELPRCTLIRLLGLFVHLIRKWLSNGYSTSRKKSTTAFVSCSQSLNIREFAGSSATYLVEKPQVVPKSASGQHRYLLPGIEGRTAQSRAARHPAHTCSSCREQTGRASGIDARPDPCRGNHLGGPVNVRECRVGCGTAEIAPPAGDKGSPAGTGGLAATATHVSEGLCFVFEPVIYSPVLSASVPPRISAISGPPQLAV